MEEFEANGNKITVNEDGTLTVVTKDGRTITMGEDGLSISGGEVKRIDIENISDLRSYEIVQEGSMTSHSILFKDGGHFKVKLDVEGRFAGMSGTKAGQTLTLDGVIVLRSSRAADGMFRQDASADE